MAATLYGEANFGLSAETGLYVASVDIDASSEEKWFRDEDGTEVGGTLYNPSATWSMNGVVKTDETLGVLLGAAIVLANVPDWTTIIPDYVSGGITYLQNTKLAYKQDDFEMADLSGGFKPFAAAHS